MANPETYSAVVRPVTKTWEDNPRSLFFEIKPPIKVTNPQATGDVIGNNLSDTPNRVRITPVIGLSDNNRTVGYMLRGYRPEIGEVGHFGESQRAQELEELSVRSALGQLVGGADIVIEIIDIPVEV